MYTILKEALAPLIQTSCMKYRLITRVSIFEWNLMILVLQTETYDKTASKWVLIKAKSATFTV